MARSNSSRLDSAANRRKQRTHLKTPPHHQPLANGVHGFMFSSPQNLNRPVTAPLLALDPIILTPRSDIQQAVNSTPPVAIPGATTTTSNNDDGTGSPLSPASMINSAMSSQSKQHEQHRQQHPQIAESGQATDDDSRENNVLFSPYHVSPTRHKYNTRSSMKYGHLPPNIPPQHQSGSYQSLQLSHALNQEEEERISSSLFEERNARLFDDELDTADLDTEEALDSFALIKTLQNKESNYSLKRTSILPLMPSTKMTLVLDLDETLVHCSTDRKKIPNHDLHFTVVFQKQEFNVFVKTRPWVLEFLEKASSIFEVVIFTASQQIYADKLLDLLDPMHLWTSKRLFRDSCVLVDGTFVKDLRILGRDLSKVIIVDNAVEAFTYQIDNGIPIKSWFAESGDRELPKLYKFLHSMVDCVDVRPILKRKFGLERRLDAVYVSPHMAGDEDMMQY